MEETEAVESIINFHQRRGIDEDALQELHQVPGQSGEALWSVFGEKTRLVRTI